MRVLVPSACLCPVLLCLCVLERCCGSGHHLITRLPGRNHSLAHGGGHSGGHSGSHQKPNQHQNQSHGGNDTEVHHRPKRGWIWNQFFVLEEHFGPDPQYVGKVRTRC